MCVFNSLLRERIHGKIPPPRHQAVLLLHTMQCITNFTVHCTKLHCTILLHCSTALLCTLFQQCGMQHTSFQSRQCNQCNVKPNGRFLNPYTAVTAMYYDAIQRSMQQSIAERNTGRSRFIEVVVFLCTIAIHSSILQCLAIPSYAI